MVYSKYAGTEVQFNGVNHLILKEDDIVGTLETDDVKDLKPLNDRVLIKVICLFTNWLLFECLFVTAFAILPENVLLNMFDGCSQTLYWMLFRIACFFYIVTGNLYVLV